MVIYIVSINKSDIKKEKFIIEGYEGARVLISANFILKNQLQYRSTLSTASS